MNPAESKTNTLVFGDNPLVAIVTLWTPVEMVASRLSKKDFGIIGNLYNAERGLDTLVRSLLSNPKIKHLVITGSDMGKSGIVLRDFFEHGFVRGKTKDTGIDVWRVTSPVEGYIEADISENALQQLRQSVLVYQWDFIQQPFNELRFTEPESRREKQVFKKKSAFAKKFFGEPAGFVFRGSDFMEPWILGLDSLIKFGHSNEKKRFLLNPVFCIYLPSKKPFNVPDFFSFSAKDCDALAKQWKKELSNALLSENSTPSLVNLSFLEKKIETRVQSLDDGLLIQAVLSSADAQAVAQLLAALQSVFSASEYSFKTVAIAVTVLDFFVPLAELEKTQSIVEKNFGQWVPTPQLVRDFRGSFVIYLSQGEIVVEHLSPGNELLFMYSGKTALSLRDQIIRENIVGTTSHALYLGTELSKAETALALGLKYVQDKPLDFGKN
ncbi:MAG: DUF4346 domain-containing protein [Candidatus Micrarchaeota archaeon]